MVRHRVWLVATAVSLGAVVWAGGRALIPEARVLASTAKRGSTSVGPTVLAPSHGGLGDEDRPHAFRLPTGDPPSLACSSARTIVAQVRHNIAYAPDAVQPHAFATATSDWLDPYGLWSVAPDAPTSATLDRRAPELLAELEGRGAPNCAAAREIGHALAGWVSSLRATFDKERRTGAANDPLEAIADATFEGATVTRPATELAALLGQRVGAIERAFPTDAMTFVSTARARYFPELDEDGWARLVLAAAVRSYVQAVDPHGDWAPIDEEASVYEVDLEARPPTRLWDRAARTPIGLRIESGAAAPFQDGDVILQLAGLATAGLALEQTEQLGLAVSEGSTAEEAIVLRRGESKFWRVSLAPRNEIVVASSETQPSSANAPADPPPAAGPPPSAASNEPGADMSIERIAYGASEDVVVIGIKDVRDDLGDALTRVILRERERDHRQLAGVVLDLRGNGGGSTDGAIDALGIFIPGAPLFPMKRRDGSLETDRAPEPPGVDRWTGPVATLVDGETASAAEMIAGALSAYHRGPIVGAPTFGKGCAQEYIDDDARAGVLRLTTLLYALPDGTPVQRVGLVPQIRIGFQQAGATHEREAILAHVAPSWRGPDVRDRAILAHADDGTWTVTWPAHGGSVGPCKDPGVCRALRALGGDVTSPAPRRVAKGVARN